MYQELLWLIIVYGTGVLITYANLMSSGLFLGSLVDPIPIRLWAVSMLLTVSSFVYVSHQLILHFPANAIVLGMYSIFLLGALTWAPMLADALQREEKTLWVALSLWLAAAGCIGLLVMSCNHPDNPLLIAASAWLVVHHLFVDAIVWYTRWHLSSVSRPLFSLDESKSGSDSQYENIEYI